MHLPMATLSIDQSNRRFLNFQLAKKIHLNMKMAFRTGCRKRQSQTTVLLRTPNHPGDLFQSRYVYSWVQNHFSYLRII